MPPTPRGESLDRYKLERETVSGQKLTFTLDEAIAAGGFGVVYRSRYRQGVDERKAAVKVFAPDPGAELSKAAEDAFRAHFLTEAKKLIELGAWLGDDRAGMAEVLAYGEVTVGGVFGLGGRKVPWIASRFVPGKTLRAWLKDRGPVSPRQCLALLTPALDVLGRIHQYSSRDGSG